ncbi:hypothetical protein CIRG_04657 [Coccidioides immitis RMSCC 2394]|uniref:Secreted protein n=1 Tax=Coccidioides immitis RMSCC 2394 TaxID=404692 RepID=A0A0J6Y8G0_COCIT|nr:hypothetical protein CIRG_04657 [Coccidioides immitis RMSCC 2394]
MSDCMHCLLIVIIILRAEPRHPPCKAPVHPARPHLKIYSSHTPPKQCCLSDRPSRACANIDTQKSIVPLRLDGSQFAFSFAPSDQLLRTSTLHTPCTVPLGI